MNMDRAINLDDVRLLAKRRLPKIAFDFIDGGAEDEGGVARNREAFLRYALVPRYLVDVGTRDQEVTLFGRTYACPLGISPMGIAGFFRPGADMILAEAAAAANIPYLLSSASCDSVERVMKVAPNNTWFQIYGTRDPKITEDLVRRARDLGVGVLVLTVDTPVVGKRERNVRNGFTRPLKLTPSIILQGLAHPAWTIGFLRHGGIPLMENWAPYCAADADANTVANLYGSQTPAPNQTWSILEAVRELWKGPLVVKGILHPQDAVLCVTIGAEGIIVSNHGGRQFDRAPSALEVLPLIRAAVGEQTTLMMDGGIRRGADLLVAMCLGAQCGLAGRPAMFGVAAAGVEGAAKVIEILRKEIDLNLAQMGCPRVSQLGPDWLLDTLMAQAAKASGAKAAPE